MRLARTIILALGVVLALPTLAQDSQVGQSKARDRDQASQSKARDKDKKEGATQTRGTARGQGRSSTTQPRDSKTDRGLGRGTTTKPQEGDWRGRVGEGRADQQETDRGRTKTQQDRGPDGSVKAKSQEADWRGRVGLGRADQQEIERGRTKAAQDRERDQDRKRTQPPIQLGKQKDMSGRSGSSNYSTRNNLRSGKEAPRISITRAPQVVTGGRLPDLVRREERVRVNQDRRYDDRDFGHTYGGYRSGYCQYDSNWRDDWFLYAFYLFTPTRNCTVSPWYYYPQLPGYINTSRISYYNGRHCDFWVGDPYQYSYSYSRYGYGEPYGYSSNYREIDRAIDDLVRGFERQDRQAIGRLVSRSRDVNVYVDNRYCYTLRSDDFYDLMMDNIFSTRTTRYEIVSVTQAYDGIRVTARHEFLDPWGSYTAVHHFYRLQPDRYGYFISDFQTSQTNRW